MGDQQTVLDTLYRLLRDKGHWPEWGDLDYALDEDAGLSDPETIVHQIDPRLIWGVRFGPIADNQDVGLTIAGLALCPEAADDVRAFIASVRHAAKLVRGVPPPAEVTLTSADLLENVELPVGGSESLLARLGAIWARTGMLRSGMSVQSGPGDWILRLDRKGLRPFRHVRTVEDFVAVVDRIEREALSQFLVSGAEGGTAPTAIPGRPNVFDRARDYIESALAARAPQSLAKLHTAEELLASGEPEHLSLALTSCRRAIKALADALHPATDQPAIDEEGDEHPLDDEAYRNRLMQFVSERLGEPTYRKFAKGTLESLWKRLTLLNELTSKGVHHKVTPAEAETCIVWTYLTAADVMRIADQAELRAAVSVESSVSNSVG